jgi:hypothetical protein
MDELSSEETLSEELPMDELSEELSVDEYASDENSKDEEPPDDSNDSERSKSLVLVLVLSLLNTIFFPLLDFFLILLAAFFKFLDLRPIFYNV